MDIESLIQIHSILAEKFNISTDLRAEGVLLLSHHRNRESPRGWYDPIKEAASLGQRVLECRPFCSGNVPVAHLLTEYMLLMYGLELRNDPVSHTRYRSEIPSGIVTYAREFVKVSGYTGPFFQHEMLSYIIARHRALYTTLLRYEFNESAKSIFN